ncbi:FtsQ-type POTRA domain-containing protein [Proteobacteria bacterium 005FR1]|nr:FtsQ-type POTRA domain-containing protein [Proteobacteria bacterium 005FR1]
MKIRAQEQKPRKKGATARRQSRSDGSGVLSALGGFFRTLFKLVAVGVVVAGASAAVVYGKDFVNEAADRPIRNIGVEGQFAFISQEAISEMVTPMIVGGFLQSPLSAIKEKLESNPWIATAVVSRRWPDQLFISIVEEQPIARWSDVGFLNHLGEIVAVPAHPRLENLPLLSGNVGQEKSVMHNYQQLAQMLRPYGLKVSEFYSDELFSWNVVLANGLRINIGRDQTMEKIQRFLIVYNRELHKRLDQVASVDLRYGNGLAVQWKEATAESERASTAPGEQA